MSMIVFIVTFAQVMLNKHHATAKHAKGTNKFYANRYIFSHIQMCGAV